MALNFVTRGPQEAGEGYTVAASRPAITVKPTEPHVRQTTAEDLKRAHVKLERMRAPALSQREIMLFERCREILLGAAEGRIPLERSEIKAQLKVLKAVGELIDRGRPIPPNISLLYRERYGDIVRNIKAYVARRSEGYARGLSFSRNPRKGLEQICDKASQALFWGVYVA